MGSFIAMDRRLARDRLAFDRSVRSFDKDGRLHVALTNISKANVCPYYGREIPNGEALGLDPDKMYRLLRDPEEIAKAAPTFNNLPLLVKHVPVTSAEPRRDLVVGSTGTDAIFEAPFLKNSLVCWDDTAIAGIESEEQKELSSAYHYVADMTPGEFEGEQYDGVMREIVGNHVALVEEGRAGPDVVVGDAKPLEKKQMIKTPALKSRKALMVSGALAAFLAPKLATDAQIDLGPALRGVNRANYNRKRATIAKAVESAVKGRLAQDADVSDLVDLLDSLSEVQGGAPDQDDLTLDGETALIPDVTGPNEDPEATNKPAEDDDADLVAKLKAAGLDDEAIAKCVAAMKPAVDADPDAPPAPAVAAPAAPAIVPKPAADCDTPMTKGAMDAALAKARSQTRRETIAELQSIQEAANICRPFIGELAVAMDSAESIYQLTLEQADVALDGVPPSAFKAMVAMLPKPGSEGRSKTPTLAADAAAEKGFSERYPDASRIKTA